MSHFNATSFTTVFPPVRSQMIHWALALVARSLAEHTGRPAMSLDMLPIAIFASSNDSSLIYANASCAVIADGSDRAECWTLSFGAAGFWSGRISALNLGLPVRRDPGMHRGLITARSIPSNEWQTLAAIHALIPTIAPRLFTHSNVPTHDGSILARLQ